MSILDQDILASIKAGERLPDLRLRISAELTRNPRTIVVLDDDPTGTQTVHGIPVITEWSQEAIGQEMERSPIFFILTNSRALQADKAIALGKCIGERLRTAAQKLGKKLLVISRSDSTLRGHYPYEVDALIEGLAWDNAKHVLAPAFFEGGRYTFRDVHYVRDGDVFIPAGKTPFAKDNTFGYKASDLKNWIIEKSEGALGPEQISSVDIASLRRKDLLDNAIPREGGRSHIICNATALWDLQTFAMACLEYEGNLIFRTAASFVNAISGIALRDCLDKSQMAPLDSGNGGLAVVGSYVSKTTQQLEFLKKNTNAVFIELNVEEVLGRDSTKGYLNSLANRIDDSVVQGSQVVLFTSRKVVAGISKAESLHIVNKVSQGIIHIIGNLQNRPQYILAKGGITSSDVATKGLGVRRAMVLGQIIPGVPVWRLGEETKFPGLPYIVFPGNVGDKAALHQVIRLLQ
ncbi:MAG: four-carbon acid sugar kinase family protein [Bacteroidota bacterium]